MQKLIPIIHVHQNKDTKMKDLTCQNNNTNLKCGTLNDLHIQIKSKYNPQIQAEEFDKNDATITTKVQPKSQGPLKRKTFRLCGTYEFNTHTKMNNIIHSLAGQTTTGTKFQYLLFPAKVGVKLHILKQNFMKHTQTAAICRAKKNKAKIIASTYISQCQEQYTKEKKILSIQQFIIHNYANADVVGDEDGDVRIDGNGDEHDDEDVPRDEDVQMI